MLLHNVCLCCSRASMACWHCASAHQQKLKHAPDRFRPLQQAPQQPTAVWTETVQTTTYVPVVGGQLQHHLGTHTLHAQKQMHCVPSPAGPGAICCMPHHRHVVGFALHMVLMSRQKE